MAGRNRLTNNSDETDIATLISGDTIFSIPYFQRAYKWKPERLRQLNADILDLVDEVNDFHFLGAVIVHGRRTNPSDPDVFDVIDGQQRITTLFLYLCAVVKVLASYGEVPEAAALFLKYLVINRDTGAMSNFKMHSCKDDRTQLNHVYIDLLSDSNFKAALQGFKLRPLAKSGADSGVVRNNYRSATRFLKDEYDQGGVDRIRSIYKAILNQMSVVQIDVWDPTNGPKIFDSLNSRQEPMTIGDLIRNEVFSRVANEHPDVIERVDSEAWQPFYKRFEQDGRNHFDGYFFPYGLIKHPNLKKSEVYSSLRKDWDGMEEPEAIIGQLAEYQNAFIDLVSEKNLSEHTKIIVKALSRLKQAGLPTSTFPFMMSLLQAVEVNKVVPEVAEAIMNVLETFIVRRATCGIEPTGLHAVFKRLWSQCGGDYTPERVAKEISENKTVAWPNAEEFRHAVESRSLYGVSVTPFLVLEYDRSLKGDTPAIVPWIEHVLPSNPDPAWFEVFSQEQHANMKDLLANLLPLTSEMNSSLSNKPYAEKRVRFREDAAFKSARQFGENVADWTPEALGVRAKELGEWAVSRWPHERPR